MHQVVEFGVVVMEDTLVVGLVGVVVEVQLYRDMEVLVDKDQVKEIVAEKDVVLVVVDQDQVQVCVCVCVRVCVCVCVCVWMWIMRWITRWHWIIRCIIVVIWYKWWLMHILIWIHWYIMLWISWWMITWWW